MSDRPKYRISLSPSLLNITCTFPRLSLRVCQVPALSYVTVQALHAMLANPDDATKIKFLYGSRSVRDVLMRDTLDAWAEQHPDRFEVVYYVGSRWRVEDIVMHYSDCPKSCGKPCSRRKVPEPEARGETFFFVFG